MSQRRSGERAAQREHCAPAGVTMAIGEKESKQIKQNTSRDGMCMCVCVYGGCFRASCEALAGGCALCQAEGGWGGCHGIAGVWFTLSWFFLFFFWLSRRCRVGRVGVQQLSIPGLLPASLSHVLNAARWVGWERVPPGLSHPLAAGGCCSPRVLALGLAAGREGGA